MSIKGASTQGNVVEVKGLAPGTTAEDVAAIFKQCGAVVDQKLVEGGRNVRVRIHFKTAGAAKAAVTKFHGQPADGKVLEVSIVGSTAAGQTLASRFGKDGLGLVRQEGSVDVLMETDSAPTSYALFLASQPHQFAYSHCRKLRSDALLGSDPRAQVLVAPPGVDPTEYTQSSDYRGGRRGGGRGRGHRRGRGGRGGRNVGSNKMDTD